MSDINLAQAVDLSKMAEKVKKEVQEEAEVRALVGDKTDYEKATQLPDPKVYRMLCAIPDAEDEFDLGNGLKLAKDNSTKRIEEHSTVVLFVVKMGDLCYKDESRFPTGPWCQEGDFVLTRAYAGTRISIHGREFRIINDDTVEAVVQDPRGIKRV